MSGGNNNLSKAKNGSRGKCGNIAHPNSVHTDLNLLRSLVKGKCSKHNEF